jgi:hemoglobin
LGEVFGGPKAYSENYGGHIAMVSHHLGRNITEEQRQRFVEAMLESADEVGLPNDTEFREQFRKYFDWGSRTAKFYSSPGDKKLPEGEPPPRWGWKGKE